MDEKKKKWEKPELVCIDESYTYGNCEFGSNNPGCNQGPVPNFGCELGSPSSFTSCSIGNSATTGTCSTGNGVTHTCFSGSGPVVGGKGARAR